MKHNILIGSNSRNTNAVKKIACTSPMQQQGNAGTEEEETLGEIVTLKEQSLSYMLVPGLNVTS